MGLSENRRKMRDKKQEIEELTYIESLLEAAQKLGMENKFLKKIILFHSIGLGILFVCIVILFIIVK